VPAMLASRTAATVAASDTAAEIRRRVTSVRSAVSGADSVGEPGSDVSVVAVSVIRSRSKHNLSVAGINQTGGRVQGRKN